MGPSPLWNRPGAKEQMNAQIDAATRLYGAPLSYEFPAVTPMGTLMVREYCFAQYRDPVLRWPFDFGRTGSGWAVSYFGFTDQSKNWPDTP